MTAWILRRLASDLFERWRHTSWLIVVPTILMCSLRVLTQLRNLRKLLQLDVYRECVCVAATDDAFHFLSHHNYLIAGLSLKQRMQSVLDHYQFEQTTFGRLYGSKVYLDDGICLWHHQADNIRFEIILEMAPRRDTEGELNVSFYVNAIRLHCLGFNWINGSLIGLPQQILPFIARNQGRSNHTEQAFNAFNLVFPNNSPGFFCFAAMQGVTLAVGLDTIAGVKTAFNVTFARRPLENFHNAYDSFWTALGGVNATDNAFRMRLPFYDKPITEIKAKYRKRAAHRRRLWSEISAASHNSMQPYLLHQAKLAPPAQEFAHIATSGC